MDQEYFGRPQVFPLFVARITTQVHVRRQCYDPIPLEEMPKEKEYELWKNYWVGVRNSQRIPDLFYILETDGLVRLDMLDGLYAEHHFTGDALRRATLQRMTTICDWAVDVVFAPDKFYEYITCSFDPVRRSIGKLWKNPKLVPSNA